MFSPLFLRFSSQPLYSGRRLARTLALLLPFCFFPEALLSQTQMSGSAYGESVSLRVAPLLGSLVQVTSGPIPQVSRDSSLPFSASDQLASVAVSGTLTGNVLNTGLITVSTTATTSPSSSDVLSTSTINNSNLQLLGALPLLGLHADVIESTARLTGCGASMVASGTTRLVNAGLSGTLAQGTIPLNPAPNTVLLNLAGIRVVLNEQILTQNGGQKTLVVNAVHVTVNALSFLGIGLLSGDVILAQSRAQLACTVAASSADLAVAATVTPNPSTVGQSLTFNITVTNHGPSTAQGVVLTPTLPAGLTWVSATPSQGTCTAASCQLGDLAANGVATIQMVARSTQSGSLVTQLAVASSTPDPSLADNSVSVTSTVGPAQGNSADLGVTATVTPNPSTVGQSLTFNITVTNRGPSTAQGVVLTPTLPAGLTWVSATPSQGTCTAASCQLGSLAANGVATVQLVARSTQSGSLVTQLAVSSSTPDPSLADNSVSVTSTVSPAQGSSANLGVTATVAPNPGLVGQPLTFDIAVVNRGPSTAQGVTLTPTLPASFVWVSSTPSQGACSSASCALGNLASGATATVRMVARASQTGTFTTQLAAASSTPDPSPADNSASVSSTIQPASQPSTSADLSLTATLSTNPIDVGETTILTLTLHNGGPAAATNVVVAIQVPDRLTLEGIQTDRGSCSGTAAVTCSVGTVQSGENLQIRLTLRATRSGTSVLSASVDSAVPDPNPSDNGVVVSLTVEEGTTGPSNPTSRGCEIDVVPAATLLVPYFAVDLGRPSGQTTLFSVINSKAQPKLAKVTLWTDWAIPTLSFNIYLTGYDVQTVNVRDLFGGQLPVTGTTISPNGAMSQPPVNFPGCVSLSGDAPIAPKLTPAELSHLAAWHTGKPSPSTGTCGGSVHSNANLAVGYITIDTVRSCSSLTPADSGYFGPNGVATDDNALWGDVIAVNPEVNSSEGDMAVHIVADPNAFASGDYTFYGRYVGGTAIDHRRPLGTQYGARYLAGSGFPGGTSFLIWRDTKSPGATGVACGQKPAWAPLTEPGILAFDEQENGELIPGPAAPLAVQRVEVDATGIPASATFGWMVLDLAHSGSLFGSVAQGWVASIATSESRYSIGQRAVRLDSACRTAQ